VTVSHLVRDAMLTRPRTHPRDLSVAQARAVLSDSHVRLLLLVDGSRLLGALDRDDLDDAPADAGERPALPLAGLSGRTVRADAPLDAVRRSMQAAGRRRLAVLDAEDRLVGLLCLKASATGFCSDAGVAARAQERLSRG